MKPRYSIVTDNWQTCYAMLVGCTFKATESHHLISGTANRKKSDKSGLQIAVCRNCHQKIHENPVLMRRFRQLAQEKFEEHHSREEFIEIFHRNYLED